MEQTKSRNSAIIANDISFNTENGVSVFKNISFSLNNEKSGLVGKNGVGKTTLLRLLVGELEPTGGKIQGTETVSYLPQDYQIDLRRSVADILGIKNTLEALTKIKAGEKDPELIKIVGEDWNIRDRVSEKFEQLNIKDLDLDRLLSSLSGGERTKVILAKLLISEPDFIILDEPTNNLDHDSREIIYDLIKGWERGLLVVSHDRKLLNLLDQILELSDKGLNIYGGNYDSYRELKEVEGQAAKRQLVHARQTIKKTKKQAQKTKENQQKRSSLGEKKRDNIGMPKALLNQMRETSETTSARLQEKHESKIEDASSDLERAKEEISPENRIVVDLSDTNVPTGKLIVEMKNVSFSYGDNRNLFHKFNLILHGPVRLALNGPNGSGKTTLIKLMLNEIKPLSGEISVGIERFAYLDQNVAILNKNETLFENLKNISDLDDISARKWLARFLFQGQEVFKKIDMFSGGERMRAALACILAGNEPPQLLVLDEPTNNLDLNSIEQIESALLNFHGALIVISHDKNFLKNIGIKEEINLP